MKVKGIKRGQIIELLEKINIPDGVEIVIEVQDFETANGDAGEGTQEKKANGTPDQQRRPPLFGSAKDLIWISDDFDEPLEDFKEYME
ncbi:DUF2281 domain-containing protein [Microcoleus sp. FACHB-68]|uniref:DUF2281 domain-containing protein n=1 Tax=Microcoleus sp. FACHB-68 TaxID=2692826 RepID=UPI001681D854|nr:DUF2281 domain-containing protein [Microcoleus sp. FACHB-68]MBD1938040.1 DUF2281 domain-containing protein [Microcoleus sp. FACHB-68]